jgi:hypothetical protein
MLADMLGCACPPLSTTYLAATQQGDLEAWQAIFAHAKAWVLHEGGSWQTFRTSQAASLSCNKHMSAKIDMATI